MKSLQGVIWGTVLGLSLTATLAWAQDQAQQPQDQQQDQQQVQEPETQAAPQPPASQYPPQAQPPQAQTPQAQPGEQSGTQADPPDRVARLQYMSGSVSIQPQGTGDWVAGAVNRPLTNSDNVWTDKDSRAELNVGTGILRMGSESSLTLTNVGDNSVQVELHQGTLNLRVRHLFNGEVFEVDTPNMAFTVQTTGEYRFDVDPNGDASIATVWKGEGDATGDGPAVRVTAHERARFTAGTSLKHEISPAPAYDGFDDWCQVRDQREDHSISAQYVAPGVIGSEDLDEYGTWRAMAPYGQVWVPSGVAVGWAPYHYGHWVWISPWGWTWMDDEPWGFAPFHYGRWVYGGGSWGWAPGPYYARPFYAPALVAWFGGPGWGASFGFGFGGGIGWCPLGFGEPFFPWYHGSRRYFERVNIYNTRINNINRFSNNFFNGHGAARTSFRYANLRAPGGAIAVPQRTLTNSLSVRSTAVRVPVNEFSRASLGGRVPVTPGRDSRLGANASRATAVSPSRSFSRPVVSRLGPSAGARMEGRGSASGNLAARPSARSFGGNASASGRFVPRPPQSNASANGGAMAARSNNTPGRPGGRSYSSPGMSGSSRNVPRPPAGARVGPDNRMSQPRTSPETRSEPRSPSNGGYARPSERSTPRSSQDSGHGRSSNFVPRPTGPVRADSSAYASNTYSGRNSYSSPAYSSGSRGYSEGNLRSYGQSPRYSAPSSGYSQTPPNRSYSAPAQRSYSAPSYRSYSAPSSRSYSAPAQRSYSAPSYRGSAPSSHGSSGSGSHSSGGGGHSGRR